MSRKIIFLGGGLAGLSAARNIEGEKHDLDKINVEKEYLEERPKASD